MCIPSEIECIIDKLCDNLAYLWNYYHTLIGLQKVTLGNRSVVDEYLNFVNSVFYSTWDSIFLRLHHFVEKRKDTINFDYLFRKIADSEKYDKNINHMILESKSEIESLKKLHLRKIFRLRNCLVAHLSKKVLFYDNKFFEENKVSLSEIELILNKLEDIINKFSVYLLNRNNDTRIRNSEYDIIKLFNKLKE